MRKLGIILALVLVLALVVVSLVYRQISYRVCWNCSGDEYYNRAIGYACSDTSKYRRTALDFLNQAARRNQQQAVLLLAELYIGNLPPAYHLLHVNEVNCLRRDIRPDHDKAISYFQAVIDTVEEQPDGDPDLLANIGQLYLLGIMPSDDPKDEARNWFARAAAEGNFPAMVQLASLADSRGDYTEAMQWFQKASASGQDVESPLKVGDYYFYGKGVVRNYQEARTWYQKALEAAQQRAAGMTAEEKSRIEAAPLARLDLVARRLEGETQAEQVSINYRLEGTVRNYTVLVDDRTVGTVVNRDGKITARLNNNLEFVTPPAIMKKSGFNSMIAGTHWLLQTYAAHSRENPDSTRFVFILTKSW